MTRDTETEDVVSVGSPRHFQAVLERFDQVLVYFYADWSDPCSEVEPSVDALAEEGVIPVAKVDVEEKDRVASVYSVSSVPTLVVFDDGDPATRAVGAKSKEDLFDFVESAKT